MNDLTASQHLENPARRDFIVRTAVAGGGLAIGLTGCATQGEAVEAAGAAGATIGPATEINAWVLVRPNDDVVIRIARSEMGQGTLTGLAQLVAEELDCDWGRVHTEHVNPGENYQRKRAWGDMSTGGSRGVRTSHDYVRRAGAAARIMLVEAAAAEWKVPAAELVVDKGVITHKASGRSTTYGKMADAAAKLAPPDLKSIKLRDPRQWKIAGTPVKRLDTADKLNGAKVFAVDVELPNMLCAAIMDCPVFGGKLTSFDESKIAGMPGNPRALRVNETAVAVVADTWWRARKALDALPKVWDEGANGSIQQGDILKHVASGLSGNDNMFADINEGDALTAIAGAAKKVEATYTVGFMAHFCMEPMNATVRISEDKAECWVATQNAEGSLATLSQNCGMPLDKCEVYKLDLGGGFGRRGGNQDYVRQATQIAMQLPRGTAVKMIWTREEDMGHDFYRPIQQARLAAGLDGQGNLVGLHIRVAGQSINAFASPSAIKDGKDLRQLQGLWKEPGDAQFGYSPPNLRTEYAMRNTHVPVGAWRGVNTNHNGYFSECFMEEVARAAGKDSVEFRRALLKGHPKHLGVLNAAAEKGDWGKPLAAGHYRGVAQFMGYGSYSAAVAEISMSGNDVKIHRMVLATNCGHAVSIAQIAAQIQGGANMGIGTLMGQCTVENGRIKENNLHLLQITRLAQMPKIEAVIQPTYDFWGGVGEPTICVVVPSILNAVFAATGKPVRNVPLANGMRIV